MVEEGLAAEEATEVVVMEADMVHHEEADLEEASEDAAVEVMLPTRPTVQRL